MRTALHRAPWALALLLPVGCAKGGLGEASEPVLRYRVDLSLSTQVEAEGAPAELLAELEALAAAEEELAMVLSWQRTEGHRDGSETVLVRFQQAALAEGGTLGLQGRSVELRRFGDGEILDLSDADRIAGGDRQGESLDLLWPMLSPHPPSLRPGEEVRKEARWPLRVDADRGQRGLLTATWTYLDNERVGGLRHHRVSYEGSWETLGSDRTREVPRGVRGEGTARGEVVFDDELSLISHTFSWERAVLIRGPALEDGERRELSQLQRFEGSVERLP